MLGGGYIRRKVTYNFGRGSRMSRATSDTPDIETIEHTDKELPLIADDGGFTPSTWEYVEMGEKEGWLKRTGYHVGNNSVIYHHYTMIHGP